MSEATEKQISFAKSLNIPDAETKTKETLKVLIDEAIKAKGGKTEKKTQPQPSNAVIGTTQGISEVKHLFQNAYEFGKAGDRATIRYWAGDIENFKKQVKELQTAKEELGLWDTEKV